MVELSIKATIHPRLIPLLRDLSAVARRELFSVGATALATTLRSYLRHQGASRHNTASRLGANPTQHIIKGAARITSRSSSNGATVSVPIAGISRAFHDLTITPKKAGNLTIPVAAASYGHRVRELKRMGWTVFTPKGRDFIMGKQDGDKEPTLLYALKKQVVIRQDRSLLPSDADVSYSINMAIGKSINQHLKRKAGNG